MRGSKLYVFYAKDVLRLLLQRLCGLLDTLFVA